MAYDPSCPVAIAYIWRTTVDDWLVVIDTDCATWFPTWSCSPGWGWRTVGCLSNSWKPRLRIFWTGARGRDSLLWLFLPTLWFIEPMWNDWHSSISWTALLASWVLPGLLIIEFPMVGQGCSNGVRSSPSVWQKIDLFIETLSSPYGNFYFSDCCCPLDPWIVHLASQVINSWLKTNTDVSM